MDHGYDPALEARLVAAVSDPQARTLVRNLLGQALAALRALSKLDDFLYARYADGAGRLLDDPDPWRVLLELRERTFAGLRAILSWAERARLTDADPATSTLTDDIDFNLDDGSRKPPDHLGLSDGDIDGVLQTFSAPEQADESQRMTALRRAVAAVTYGLQRQLLEHDARTREAARLNQFNHALEDLDDVRNSTSEGLFALVHAIYQAFLPDVDAANVLPGYMSSLGKALLIRRAVADLSRAVERENWVIQDASSRLQERQAAVRKLRDVLGAFIRGEVFPAMRPADRWEVIKVQRALTSDTGTVLAQTCEGLAKYLESLSSVSRREVLVRHDAEVLREVRTLSEAARSMLADSPAQASKLVLKAMEVAGSGLYGRSPDLDAVFIGWRLSPPDLAVTAELSDTLTRLETMGSLSPG